MSSHGQHTLMHQAAHFLYEHYKITSLDKSALNRLFDAYKNPNQTGTQITSERIAAAYVISRGLSIAGVISQILSDNHDFFAKQTSIMDFGGGPGTFLWAFLEDFELSEYTNLDLNHHLLAVFKHIAKHLDLTQFKHLQQDYFKFTPKHHIDLGVMSYTLCENESPAPLLRKASETCDSVLIIEPGTPLGFSNITKARALLLEKGFKLLAPCTTQGQCPLIDQEDWCHFAKRISRTKQQMFLKNAVIGHEDEKYTYLLASKKDQPASDQGVRVISKPKHEQHQISFRFCSESTSPETARISKKHQKAHFKLAKKAQRGSLFTLPTEE